MIPDKKTRTDGRAMLMKVLAAGSTKLTVTEDSTNNQVSLDVSVSNVEPSIVHQNISGAGTNTHAQIDTALSASTTHIAASAPHSGHEATSTKNAANGYAGLNASSRITKGADTTDDLIIDSTVKGIVLKDTNGHYWRVKIDTLGSLVTTDLGTTKP